MTMRKLLLSACLVLALAVAPAALAASSLSGTYKTKVTSKADNGRLKGTWTVTFKKGTYTVKQNGKGVVKGKDTFKSGRVTFHDTSGPGKCPGTATYKYKVTGKKLKFTNVSDKSKACIGRETVLKGTFTKA